MHHGGMGGQGGGQSPSTSVPQAEKPWAQEPFYCIFESLLSGCVMLAKANIMRKWLLYGVGFGIANMVTYPNLQGCHQL